ncbi:MAG: hypothetical protein JXB32_07725 [Deltaproteobacteria bacterium]|nr:hypothetical protein [Deltaproteobacteria bacterium]
MRRLALALAAAAVACPPPPVETPPPPLVVRPAGAAAAWFPDAFDPDLALSLVAFLDQRFREPGNAPYREALDELESRLRRAGFGERPGLLLERWTLVESAPTWEPLAATLEVVAPEPAPLLSFVSGADRERTMLLIGSPGTDGPLEAELQEEGQGDPKGRALLARGVPEESYARLARELPAFVLFRADARWEGPVSRDDAIPFANVPTLERGPPAVRLSRRAESRLRELLDKGASVVLRLDAGVRLDRGPVEMLHAEVRGGELPGLAFAAHLDEPGAEDNASGVAVAVGLAELLATGLRRSVDAPPPNRSLHFLFGPELDHVDEAARRLAPGLGWAVALDQVGRPPGPGRYGEPTRALVERSPDPSLRWRADTGPGSGWLGDGVEAGGSWSGSPAAFLADVLVALLRDTGGDWVSHPFEGGSDHVPFLAYDVPSALVWKFPDPTYHTSLDRLGPGVVDAGELERVGEAMLALVRSLAWEDGALAVGAAAEAARGRLAALAAEPAGACAWTSWLLAAVDDLSRVLGPLAAAEPAAGTLRTLREELAAGLGACPEP